MIKRSLKSIAALAVALGLTTVPALASADGLVAKSKQISAAQRLKLKSQITKYRKAEPEVFKAVRNLQGHRPEVYRKRRNPKPNVTVELRRMGRKALLPMLEALAFDAPDRRSATDAEWQAVKVGMLHVVGELRDKRSAPILRAAFKNAGTAPVLRAAAEAMGRLCDNTSYKLLSKSASSSGAKRLAAVRGLGQCRRLASAQQLAAMLEASPADKEAIAVAESLGFVGSSWAWRTKGKKQKDKGMTIRELAATVLVPAFIDYQGKARDAAQVGLSMVEFPGTRQIVAQHRHRADKATAARLDRIVARIERRLKKR